jgi:hypothetical protein
VKTLQQYLTENGNNHVLISSIDQDKNISFYIHPSNTSGATLDFVCLGNVLLPAQVKDPTGIVVKTASQIIKSHEQVIDTLKTVNSTLERAISELDRLETKINHVNG